MEAPSDPGSLRDRLQRALVESMRSRDPSSIAALRGALSAIANAEAVEPGSGAPLAEGPIAYAVSGLGAGEVARRELTDADVVAVVQAEIDERETASLTYVRLGRDEEADRLRGEADVLRRQLDARSARAVG